MEVRLDADAKAKKTGGKNGMQVNKFKPLLQMCWETQIFLQEQMADEDIVPFFVKKRTVVALIGKEGICHGSEVVKSY